MSPARPVWQPAWVGLGSNLEDPRRQVLDAFDDLGSLPDVRLVVRSPLYRSLPMGRADQPDFVNAVAGLLTRLAPEALLAALQAVEQRHGRRRSETERWGPRTLDLDLLVYGDLVLDGPGLSLPHPGIGERNFVLLPLAGVAPHLVVPGLGRVETLAGRLGDQGIERIDSGKDEG